MYKFKRQPREHQRRARAAWGDKHVFALLMEQGTGKTKVVIDFAGEKYADGEIDMLIVLAPPDVRIGWVIDALPKDMSPQVPYRAAWYESNPRKKQRLAIESVLDRDFVGLRVITMHYEALAGAKGQAFLAMLVRTFRCFVAADESTKIKNMKAKRTAFAIDVCARTPYRCVLNGTPITKGPFDAYSQFRFLDETILGHSSIFSFKAHYCEMEESDSFLLRHISQRANAARAAKGQKSISSAYMQVPKKVNGKVAYRNLSELRARIEPWAFRVLKKDCLDLPPKEYSKRYIELPDVQRKLYDSVRDNLITEMGMGSISPMMKMTRMMRLQQILGGHYVLDDDDTVYDVFDKLSDNPRLDSVGNVFEQSRGKLIVWARFKHEVRDIDNYLTERFSDEGYTGVMHYGDVDVNTREINKKRYIEQPNVRWFVGTQSAGARGLDGLQQVTSDVYYYSNSFSLDDRLQSEDRAHRDGTSGVITIHDAVALETMDVKLIDTLRSNKDVADMITGDEKLEWI